MAEFPVRRYLEIGEDGLRSSWLRLGDLADIVREARMQPDPDEALREFSSWIEDQAHVESV